MHLNSTDYVKLFLGLIITDRIELDALSIIQLHMANSEKPRLMDFSHTTYYKNEMGDGLKKMFVSIDPLISVFSSYQTKLDAIKLKIIIV